MKILVSGLPNHDWWGEGITAYDDNWGMADGVVPDVEKVKGEYESLLSTLRKYTEVEIVPFPDQGKYPGINDDFVFVRDQFISGNDHRVVICNLRRPERKHETDYIKDYFNSIGVGYSSLSQEAIADGGEFYYLPKEKVLFAGLSRNSKKGVEEMGRLLRVNEVVLVETKAYHLDTAFTVMLDKDKNLAGVITCPQMLKDPDSLIEWLKERNLPLIIINQEDTIGPKEVPGNQAVNSLQLPGVLISTCEFVTPGVEEQVKRLGIEHVITSTSQFNLSGGSVHCLTNEL